MRYLALALLCCRAPSASEDGSTQASPQALATPAPLSSVPAAMTSSSTTSDAGPPPSALHFDRALPTDVGFTKEVSGYSLEVSLRPLDAPMVPKSPEVASAIVETLRKKTEPRLTIDLGAGRVRVRFGVGTLLPAGTELRARADRYGQILLSPEGTSYRVLEPGVLRALLGERRLDASTLSGAEVSPRGEGQRLGTRTRKIDLVTRAGKGSFELARLADMGEAGVVLARMLGTLLDAPPATTLATEGEVPLRLELAWATATRGGLLFEVTSMTKRTDLGARELAVPPATANFTTATLPSQTSELLVTAAEIPTLHAVAASAPRGNLVMTNASDEVRFAWLEGVPVAWIAPRGRVDIPGMPKGKYEIVFRSFLGDVVDPARAIEIPGNIDASGADAGP